MREGLLVVLIALLAGCEGTSNTICTIGTLLCTNAEGDFVENGDAHLRRCAGPAEGGDEDGEFVIVTDCAATGDACYIDSLAVEEVGGCVTRACADDGIIDCIEPGSTNCAFDRLQVCGNDAASGCNRYFEDTACEMSGGTCVEMGGMGVCMN